MGELFSENWKVFPAMFLGAFVLGLLSVLYMRDALKKWIFNGHSGCCPLEEKKHTPLSKEAHEEICGKEWEDHNRISSERWVHNQEIAAKNRELLLSEIDHLKASQDKISITVDKIFERLERRP